MADYIKREDAIRWNPASKERRDYGTFNLDDAYETGYEDKIKQIEKIPAADVRENVHVEWILDDDDDYYELWKCSVCGNGIFDHRYYFCPNCGADMRGKKDG